MGIDVDTRKRIFYNGSHQELINTSVSKNPSGAILLLRGIPEKKNALLHRGVWRKAASGSFETRGKKLGIVGYGNIGSQLSVLAESMGMQVML